MDNKVSIEIYGSHYPITTREAADYVQELGMEIDIEVREIMKKGSASITQALVLVALSYLDEFKKAEKGADHLREQVGSYLEEASQAKFELAGARAEIERLNRDHQLKMDET